MGNGKWERWANFFLSYYPLSPSYSPPPSFAQTRAALYTAENPTITGCGVFFAGHKLTASFTDRPTLVVNLSCLGPTVQVRVGAGPQSGTRPEHFQPPG